MAEVAHAGKHHGNASLVGRRDHLAQDRARAQQLHARQPEMLQQRQHVVGKHLDRVRLVASEPRRADPAVVEQLMLVGRQVARFAPLAVG